MIFADIPVNEPNNEFSGYSRAGKWHIVLDTEGYTSRSPACVDPPFSTCKVKHQYLQAFRSVDEERKYREKEAEQAKAAQPAPELVSNPAIKVNTKAAPKSLKAEHRRATGRKASAVRWGKAEDPSAREAELMDSLGWNK
jgi:catalase